MAVDPLESKYSPESPYNYCHNNPVRFTDPSGMAPNDTDAEANLQSLSASAAANPGSLSWKGDFGETYSYDAKEKTASAKGLYVTLYQDSMKEGPSLKGNMWNDLNSMNAEISIPSNFIYFMGLQILFRDQYSN